MPAQHEEISPLCNDRSSIEFGNFVSWVRLLAGEVCQYGVDLAGLESCDADVEIDFRERDLQLSKFDRQRFTIPTRVFGEPVIRQRVGAKFSFAEMPHANDRDLPQAEKLCGFGSCVTSNDSPAPIYDDGCDEAKTANIVRNLLDLAL